MVTTVMVILFGSALGWQLHTLFKSVTQYMNAKQLAKLKLLVHALTAVSAIEAVLLQSAEIARFIAAVLSDHIGIWIVTYCGKPLHFIAGWLGEISKSLFDYAALVHPVDPVLQAVALFFLVQMLTIEILSKEKK